MALLKTTGTFLLLIPRSTNFPIRKDAVEENLITFTVLKGDG